MKTFKRVYFSVMAILVVVMLALGLCDASVGTYKNRFDGDFETNLQTHVEKLAEYNRNIYNNAHLTASRNYIVKYLGDYVTVVEDYIDEEDGMNYADANISAGKPAPTLVVQTATVSQETQNYINLDKNSIHVDKTVNNILVYIPGSDTKDYNPAIEGSKLGDVVMMTAHYDSVKAGAMDNASSVAAMLEVIRNIADPDNEISYKNDLLLVFTDAKEEGFLGAFAVRYQFKGFDDVMSRVKMGSNFDSLGNCGSLIMYETSENNSALVSTYARINDGTFASSITNFVYSLTGKGTDFKVYDDIPSLNFANVGGSGVNNSSSDNIENANLSITKQVADMMFKVTNYYGDYNLSDLSSDKSSAFFSYLDIMTVYYPAVVSFILCGLIIGLIAAIAITNRKKKVFSWIKTCSGAGMQALSVLATAAVSFAFYFLVTLILAGLGAIPIQSMTSIRGMNIGVMIFAMILTGALLSGFYVILRKAFNIKAGDVVRGNAFIWVAIALILGFAVPATGYIFVIVAILELVVILLTVLFRDKYNAKYTNAEGDKSLQGIGGLFLHAWPMIIALPLVVPFMFITGSVLNAVLLPVVMMLFSLMAGAVLPYITYLTPVLDRLAKKLPKRTVKYKKEVTERVEDKAKKGRFTDVTSVKVFKEEIERKYVNSIGIAIASVICVIALVLCSAFGHTYSKNLTAWKSFDQILYDGAIVYVYDQTTTTTAERTLEVRDPMAYKYISEKLSGFEWNAEKSAYVKTYNNEVIRPESIPTISKTGDGYSFRVYDSARSKVKLVLSNVKSVTKITFNNGGESLEYENEGKETFTFMLPYGWGNFTMTTEGNTSIMEISYTEEVIGNRTSEEIDDVKELRAAYGDNEKVEPYISSGIVIKLAKSLG